MAQALDGVRILDFGWGWAGPYAATMLGLFGADVIKIETAHRPDFLRIYMHPITHETVDPDEAPIFHGANLGKKGITLDVTRPGALKLAERLVQISDVVVESFRPGVMERLGLGYERLRQIKPDIIMLASNANGQTGPEAKLKAYAPLFCALSGLGDITGYKDGPPTEIRQEMDITSAVTAAVAVMAAVIHRKQTGHGQFIDLSSCESISCLIGDSFLGYSLCGRVPVRDGNRDIAMVPHNCYPCKGEDKWISIAIGTHAEWEAVCRAMGNPEWVKDARFNDPASRWQNQAELDDLIAQYTRRFTTYELMAELQKSGVAAVPSFTAEDLCTDPHLAERGFFQVASSPKIGNRFVPGIPWKLSGTPGRITGLGPTLGQHNDYVFKELLGLSSDEIDELKKEGAIE